MVKYFHFHDLSNNQFYDAELQSAQCEYKNPITGSHCRKRCQIGLDLCWVHLQSTLNLRIRPSAHLQRILGITEMGLYVLIKKTNPPENEMKDLVFSNGDYICHYNSQEISKSELNRRYQKNTAPYGVGPNFKKKYLDGAIRRGVGSMINHSPDKKIVNCQITLISYKYDSDGEVIECSDRDKKQKFQECQIIATKNIYNGQELLCDYGEDYEFSDPDLGIYSATNYKRQSI